MRAHSFVSEFYRSGADVVPGQVYYGNYEFLKSERPFRSQIVTPKPEVLSMHTAKVVGKDGEEIDTDEYGRIRVKFFWDRDKAFSRWVRVRSPGPTSNGARNSSRASGWKSWSCTRKAIRIIRW